MSNVTIAPASPYTDDALTCSYSYADVDGNADASSYSWTVASTSGGAGTVVGTEQPSRPPSSPATSTSPVP